ncbi:MAG: hypothetical protein K1060chlam4_00065 [Candidatus Anoxychlamydiales bacterium]|nr:hypothetical protein [Candidatus Anoxychlamydiales bacterium]
MGNIRAITDVNPFLAVNHVNDEELLGIQENADNDQFDPIDPIDQLDLLDLFDRNNNEENLRARIQQFLNDEELFGRQETEGADIVGLTDNLDALLPDHSEPEIVPERRLFNFSISDLITFGVLTSASLLKNNFSINVSDLIFNLITTLSLAYIRTLP